MKVLQNIEGVTREDIIKRETVRNRQKVSEKCVKNDWEATAEMVWACGENGRRKNS